MRVNFWDRGTVRRIRYVLIAVALAFLVSVPNLLIPFDMLAWTFQAKVGEHELSGDIVFVEVPENVLEDPVESEKFRRSLDELGNAGAEAIFLDLARLKGGAPNISRELKSSIQSNERIYAVGRHFFDRNREKVVFPPKELFGRTKPVVAGYYPDFMGFVWRVPSTATVDGVEYQSLSSSLAGVTTVGSIEVDYHFDAADVPVLYFDAVPDAVSVEGYAQGKSFVFGYSPGASGAVIDLPGSLAAPASYVAIFAAETLKKGGVHLLGIEYFYYAPALGLCSFVLLMAMPFGSRGRRVGYAIVLAVSFFALLGPVFIPFRTGIAPTIFFLAIYALQSLTHRWRSHLNLESSETGLPTVQRLERDLLALARNKRFALISVKIQNFSEVMATLPAESKFDYFNGIVKRLRVGDTTLSVYTNGSDRLFFLQPFETQDTVRAHLIALLAIFKSPLRIQDRPYDIALTFAVDLNFIGEAHRRISRAEALTDKTTLSSQPIIFGNDNDAADEEWRVSLQSKIDAALDANEIYPVFQPQVCIQSGQIVGYEGLVRWNDTERGHISPSYFVEQCEQAGRMEKLQQFMLRECISRFQASKAMETDAKLSINVSATLLADTWLSEFVTDVLETTGFPAERLVLEITETARIHDHHTATAVLGALAAFGVELSLDDFGTGTAGLENFYRLPFSELKVDRLFTASLAKSNKARVIVANAILLGKSLGVRVIVEGVEDQESLAILANIGCAYVQGYLFGKPNESINSFENKRLDWLKTS